MNFRIGHGYDVHKFGGTGPLILCGVPIQYEFGLLAHSDGDVALHALCDALLGAVALGDIGQHFPDTDQHYANADSRKLLSQVYALVRNQGYELSNADITIAAEAPKLMPHIMEMRRTISQVMDVDISIISVKATTTEKLGFVGRKEGIAVDAVVLLNNK